MEPSTMHQLQQYQQQQRGSPPPPPGRLPSIGAAAGASEAGGSGGSGAGRQQPPPPPPPPRQRRSSADHTSAMAALPGCASPQQQQHPQHHHPHASPGGGGGRAAAPGATTAARPANSKNPFAGMPRHVRDAQLMRNLRGVASAMAHQQPPPQRQDSLGGAQGHPPPPPMMPPARMPSGNMQQHDLSSALSPGAALPFCPSPVVPVPRGGFGCSASPGGLMAPAAMAAAAAAALCMSGPSGAIGRTGSQECGGWLPEGDVGCPSSYTSSSFMAPWGDSSMAPSSGRPSMSSTCTSFSSSRPSFDQQGRPSFDQQGRPSFEQQQGRPSFDQQGRPSFEQQQGGRASVDWTTGMLYGEDMRQLPPGCAGAAHHSAPMVPWWQMQQAAAQAATLEQHMQLLQLSPSGMPAGNNNAPQQAAGRPHCSMNDMPAAWLAAQPWGAPAPGGPPHATDPLPMGQQGDLTLERFMQLGVSSQPLPEDAALQAAAALARQGSTASSAGEQRAARQQAALSAGAGDTSRQQLQQLLRQHVELQQLQAGLQQELEAELLMLLPDGDGTNNAANNNA